MNFNSPSYHILCNVELFLNLLVSVSSSLTLRLHVLLCLLELYKNKLNESMYVKILGKHKSTDTIILIVFC